MSGRIAALRPLGLGDFRTAVAALRAQLRHGRVTVAASHVLAPLAGVDLPPASRAPHRVSWAGLRGNPHAARPHGGLLCIEPEDVPAEIAERP